MARALVVGLGKSGKASLEVLKELSFEVAVHDQKTAPEIPDDFTQFDLLVVSPGVSLDNPVIKKAIDAEVEIIGEIELAYRYGKGKYVAITGTNGKTTTTALTGEIFKCAGIKTEVVGNIGTTVADRAIHADDDDVWFITEISSFQLESIKDFRPKVSAILNLTPDHLDRHKTIEEYAKTKKRVYLNQTEKDFFVVNMDDDLSSDFIKDTKAKIMPFSRTKMLKSGCYVENGQIYGGVETIEKIYDIKDIRLKGEHNLENYLAAAAISLAAGIEIKHIKKGFDIFPGVAHRLEYVGTFNGVNYYNDSKGTNTDSSIKAVKAIEKPIILIAGGYDKSADFDVFIKSFDNKVKALVLLGTTAEKIAASARNLGFNNIFMAKDMEEAVEISHDLAEKGDNVLLSPACASWDMYTDFEERGEHFKKCIQKIQE